MTKPLWTAQEAAEATGGKALGDWKIHGISIDTRSLMPGDLFIALKDVRDGHDFIGPARQAGAAACMVSRDMGDIPALRVDDTLDALVKLGLAARARTDAFCCAVTGSVGKTSVKEMLARIFRASGPSHWNVKSFNNHFGVPITLARMPAETIRAVFEIGMNTPGEIEPRSKMVRPHAAMITKIAAAHLEGMGSEQAVAEEKAAIFAGLEPGGVAILPKRDAYFDFLSGKARSYCPDARILTFGPEGSDSYCLNAETDGLETRFDMLVLGERVSVTVNAIGAHWGENIAAALLMACVSGLTATDAASALNGYAPPEGRGKAEWLALASGGRVLLVDDAYNANPESMRASLDSFRQRPARRHIIALGEMKELGEDAEALHAGLAPDILACNPIEVLLAGQGILPLKNILESKVNTVWAEKALGLHEKVNKLLTDGDALLIKGSNASGMRGLADALRAESAAPEEREK